MSNQLEVKFCVFVSQSSGGEHCGEQGQPEANTHRSVERFTKPSRAQEAGELSCRPEECGKHLLVQCCYTGQCQLQECICLSDEQISFMHLNCALFDYGPAKRVKCRDISASVLVFESVYLFWRKYNFYICIQAVD